ncbi:MAG: sulfotransferase, partial [Sphingobacteriales bacterium]
MKPFFITGMYRSGTTLLAKLLGGHPQAAVASQPAPLLYAEIKKQFLQSVNSSPEYPLGHLFNEAPFTNSDFTDFLSEQKLSKEFISQALAKMQHYSGQY